MFEFIKNIFGNRPDEEASEGQGKAASNGARANTLPTPASKTPVVPSRQNHPAGNGTHASGNRPGGQPTGAVINLPLNPIIANFPPELKGRVVRQSEIGDTTVQLPLDSILPQLAGGSVKISFGELRRTAPQFFAKESDRDQVALSIPLPEILARINPAMLTRRQNQKHVEIPPDINSPFGDRGVGLAVSLGTPKAPTPDAAVTPRSDKPSAPVPPAEIPAMFQPKPIQPPKTIQPAAPVAGNTVPSAAPIPNQPNVTPIPFRSSIPAAAKPTPPAPAPIQPAAPASIPFNPAPRLVTPTPAPASHSNPTPIPTRVVAPITPPAIASPAKLEAAITEPVADGPVLTIPLSTLNEAWPDSLRLEIAQLNLGLAEIALPIATAEDAMKRGRVAFPWKTIRAWIKPAPVSVASVHDNTVLELPLPVITPLFIAAKKAIGKIQPKVSVDDSIPNLFFGFPQPEEASPAPPHVNRTEAVNDPAAKSLDTNYYVWDDTSDSARVDETEFKRKAAPGPLPGTDFVNRYATPNEVVSRAAALEGVSGALIALPDGLMVASKLSPELNGDTLAAFLPHIFGKVSQCTKELRMGELNNLNFTVGNVPWKIFRVNAIFFAAFGRAGQALPTAQLAALAAELDHKKQ